MKALGYNPHVAFQIALAGNAADMSSIMIEPRKGGEQLPKLLEIIVDYIRGEQLQNLISQ